MTDKPTDDLLQRCRELLELNEKGESQQTALRALAATYDREIPAHDRRAMAVSQTHLEAMRALLAATQQASTEIDELKSKLAFYEREREDQIRYLAAQSAEIAGLKQRLAKQSSGEVMEKRILELADKYRIDYGGDYSRNAKEHELDLLAFVRAVLPSPTQHPSGEVTHGNTTMDECMASLLDRLEVAEMYADRYRYLRERPLDAVSSGGVFAGKTPDNVVLNGADLDAAIDAARAQGGES